MTKYSLFLLTYTFASCTIKFDVTSQRTALENQILGTYKELDEDVILISSVRAVNKEGQVTKIKLSVSKEEAIAAKQNQAFNQDDIEEFKTNQFVGEGSNGLLKILPNNIGLSSELTGMNKKIVNTVVAEENRDRKILWKRVITLNPELNDSHLKNVISTFKKQSYEQGKPGHWFEKNDKWVQKK